MHLIASHRQRPADDPIFALNREATQRRQRGEDIVNASIGVLLDDEGKLAVLPAATRAVQGVTPLEWAAYAPIAGTPDFLQAVIDDLLGAEPEMARAAVAVATPGGSGAIRHAVANFLDPGQALLTTSWYWGPYQTIAEESDRRFETFSMFTDASAHALDVAALDAALTGQLARQGRALVVLNDPCHNPTGYSMTAAEWEAVVSCLAKRAAQGPITLLVDCAYLHYGSIDPRAVVGRVRGLLGKANVLFAWSASKSFTQYGLRVGALVACVADEGERGMIERALSYSCRGTWSNCSRGGQTAIARLLVDPALSRECAAERARLNEVLHARVATYNRHAQRRGLRHPRYEGGFFVTVFDDHPREKAEALRARGIYVVPQLQPGGGGGALRVALCAVSERDVARLVEAL